MKLTVEKLKTQVATYDATICEFKDEIDELKKPKPQQKIYTKRGGKYVEEIRQVVYRCARRQVPIHSISTVIGEIAQTVFCQQLDPLPSPSTIGNMIHEMGILSTTQAVEAMLNSQYVNLSWDATSIDSSHINEIHVNTDSGSYALCIQELPGGTTEDYVQHITSTLEQAAEVYAKMKSLNKQSVLDDIKKRITSTTSDRAAVNHCVSREVGKYVGHDVLELNCNIHPLDSLSIAFRKLCKEFEGEQGAVSSLFGAEAALIKVILNICKMRYKAKGDPSGFSSFMDSHNIDRKLMMRYVGNRFHILFELAGNIYYMRQLPTEYFHTFCQRGEQYRNQIAHDLNIDIVVKEFVVCGWFGMLLKSLSFVGGLAKY